ncbi:hypothetical protein Gohar_019053, partial [Gossypium harknessii]|nr:hypothetical protein [Gossypium harknessii]
MLSSPNDESPANVEAAKEWRETRDEFKRKVSRCLELDVYFQPLFLDGCELDLGQVGFRPSLIERFQ